MHNQVLLFKMILILSTKLDQNEYITHFKNTPGAPMKQTNLLIKMLRK